MLALCLLFLSELHEGYVQVLVEELWKGAQHFLRDPKTRPYRPPGVSCCSSDKNKCKNCKFVILFAFILFMHLFRTTTNVGIITAWLLLQIGRVSFHFIKSADVTLVIFYQQQCGKTRTVTHTLQLGSCPTRCLYKRLHELVLIHTSV